MQAVGRCFVDDLDQRLGQVHSLAMKIRVCLVVVELWSTIQQLHQGAGNTGRMQDRSVASTINVERKVMGSNPVDGELFRALFILRIPL